MSINVTVTGNPVSIKRGKMVTANPYDEKQEFEKRRLMRLEQVRQQSKDFAQDVRNKVKREKTKQMGKIKNEKKEELKSWQNRRLLDLQTQYKDALDDIGMGHKAAKEFEDENEILEQQKRQNESAAQARGKVAIAKSQIERNEANFKKAMPIQQKKLVRDIENARAAMVSGLEKHERTKKYCKKNKKVKSTDINITVPDESSQESTQESSSAHKDSPLDEDSEYDEDCSCSEESSNNECTSVNGDSYPADRNYESGFYRGERISEPEQRSPDFAFQKDIFVRKPLIDQTPYHQSIENRRKLIENFQNPSVYAKDTRISDRIRQRELQASEPDFCDYARVSKVDSVGIAPLNNQTKSSHTTGLTSKENVDPGAGDVCECIKYHLSCPCKTKSISEPFRNISVQTDRYRTSDKCTCNHHQPGCPKASRKGPKRHSGQVAVDRPQIVSESCTQTSIATSTRPPKSLTVSKPTQKQVEIPMKPPISLKIADKGVQSTKSVKTSTVSLPQSQRVNYYDHPNRYQGTLPSTANVERIGPESLEVMPNIVSEAEWHEKMRQRDREAQVRGKQAMEKEAIRRDYEDMMRKLPLLQRKEHIAEIGRDKPEYHMSEERLIELERKKQVRLENAFTKAFPDLQPAIVTLPSKKRPVPSSSNEPFDILDPSDTRIKHTGKWDTDFDSPKMFTIQEVQEIIKSFTGQKQEDRYSKLKQLLKSLKMQKEQLIRELQALPRDDSVNALLDDLNSVSDSDDAQRSRRSKQELKKGERDKATSVQKDKKRRHFSSDDPSSSSDSRTKDMAVDEDNKNRKSSSKKSKKKRQKVLVLQNMSTQTTPKAVKDKPSTSSSGSKDNLDVFPSKICNKTHSPCDCRVQTTPGSTEELCQIVIKLQDNEEPRIQIVNRGDEKHEADPVTQRKNVGEGSERKSKKTYEEKVLDGSKKNNPDDSPSKLQRNSRRIESKPVSLESDVFKKPLPKDSKKVRVATFNFSDKRNDSSRSKVDTSKQASWKDQLSKNSMSSSTSYFSPPDFTKRQESAGSFYNLHKKPRQQNVSTNSSNDSRVDPKVLKYIEKLLSMSKASVDDLGVSSSDVQTPSQSIIEMESNNPLAQLHNIVKMINLKANEAAKELSYSTDASAVPPNSVVNISDDSQNRSNKSQGRSDKTKTELSQVQENDGSNGSSRKSRDSLLHQYADVTDSCSKRIANLAAMIEKLRDEKMRMFKDSSSKDNQPSPKSTKDYSTTAYLDLPHSEKSMESSKASTATSLDEEELNKRLLEIDMNLAEKLKRFSQAKMDADRGGTSSEHQIIPGNSRMIRTPAPIQNQDSCECSDDENRQFLERLQRLMEKSGDHQPRSKVVKTPESHPKPPESSQDLTRTESRPFVPLLLNIPQLPILEPLSDDYVSESGTNGHKHPPPSKGLAAIKRINGNFSVVPHELSTIVEADSQLSTKVSPNTSKLSLSPSKDNQPFIQVQDKSPFDSLPPLIIPDKSLQSHYESTEKKSPKTSQIVDQMGKRSSSPEKVVNFKDNLVTSVTDTEKCSIKNRNQLSSASSNQDKSTNTSKSTSTEDNSTKSTESSVSIVCTDATCNNLSSTASKSSMSSSSSDDLKSLEAMLKSIGMDWAIPTLHKTQEALALASSSSSPEVSSSRKEKSKSSISRCSPCGSEVSLKDFLTKQMMSKISSSSMKSEASPVSFLQELSDISAIHASSGSEKAKQRTSTPLGSKATSKSKDSEKLQFFTGASDISSVKVTPKKKSNRKIDEDDFKSLSNSTPSTNHETNN